VGAAYDEFAADPEARTAVVFGHGEHFSAGLDLADVLPAVAQHGPGVLAGRARHDPFGIWAPEVPKPVVLAVQGIAFNPVHRACSGQRHRGGRRGRAVPAA
jgi:enoyl-CoA hydratase